MGFKLDSVGEGDALLGISKEPGNNSTLGNSREIPVNCPRGIRQGSSQKMKMWTAQLKCLCTNAHSMGNKQEELEALVQLEN